MSAALDFERGSTVFESLSAPGRSHAHKEGSDEGAGLATQSAGVHGGCTELSPTFRVLEVSMGAVSVSPAFMLLGANGTHLSEEWISPPAITEAHTPRDTDMSDARLILANDTDDIGRSLGVEDLDSMARGELALFSIAGFEENNSTPSATNGHLRLFPDAHTKSAYGFPQRFNSPPIRRHSSPPPKSYNCSPTKSKGSAAKTVLIRGTKRTIDDADPDYSIAWADACRSKIRFGTDSNLIPDIVIPSIFDLPQPRPRVRQKARPRRSIKSKKRATIEVAVDARAVADEGADGLGSSASFASYPIIPKAPTPTAPVAAPAEPSDLRMYSREVQGKICRALPHNMMPKGFTRFHTSTQNKQFLCTICKSSVPMADLQGQWNRRDMSSDPDVGPTCVGCWTTYTNFSEKVKKEVGYREFLAVGKHIHRLGSSEDVDYIAMKLTDCLKAAFGAYYCRRRTGGSQLPRSSRNMAISQFFWSDFLGSGALGRACFCGHQMDCTEGWSSCDCWERTFKSPKPKHVPAFRKTMCKLADESRVDLIARLRSYSHTKWGNEALTKLLQLDEMAKQRRIKVATDEQVLRMTFERDEDDELRRHTAAYAYSM